MFYFDFLRKNQKIDFLIFSFFHKNQLCDTLIDINDSHAKNHLKNFCPGVKSTPLSTDHSRSDLFQRLAAIGARKKLFSSDHTFSPSPTQTPGSIDRQGMG